MATPSPTTTLCFFLFFSHHFLCCFSPIVVLNFSGYYLVPSTRLKKMQAPCNEPLAIDDNNKVNDSITTLLIAMVEGQDIPSEVVPHDASIDPSRLVAKGEDLQNAKLKISITNGLSSHIFN
jgi:hypothetical protein